MNYGEYLTKQFQDKLGELDLDERELLQDAIEFEEISEKIARLF